MKAKEHEMIAHQVRLLREIREATARFDQSAAVVRAPYGLAINVGAFDADGGGEIGYTVALDDGIAHVVLAAAANALVEALTVAGVEDVETIRIPKLPPAALDEWTDADAALAESEGWAFDLVGTIIPAPGRTAFEGRAAFEYVRSMAEDGSTFHRRAIDLVGTRAVTMVAAAAIAAAP